MSEFSLAVQEPEVYFAPGVPGETKGGSVGFITAISNTGLPYDWTSSF